MDSALREADGFLAPVLNKSNRTDRGKSVIHVLSSPAGENEESRQHVIVRALDLLQNLHDASCITGTASDQPFASQRERKLVHTLLDLVVLEGIYPSLSPGVGLPMEQRVKSALNGHFVTRPLTQHHGGQPRDQQLLALILDRLYPMLLSRKGVAPSMDTRVSVDLIAAVAELAYSPAFAAESRQAYLSKFHHLLDSKSALHLFPMLTSLLHPSCPLWLRSPLTSYLSLLPLRPNGVRQTINFVAGLGSGSDHQADRKSNNTSGPNLSLDNLGRATKLLTSVPSRMTADEYFSALAPQVLDLLDDSAIDNKRIASHIIGIGILGKRSIGSPGTIGWRLFAEPILEALGPPIETCPVSESLLKLAIDRLSALLRYHPNPGLTKRLVVPILLPLWGLQGYALDHQRTNWADQVHQILGTYMKISVTESQLLLLSDHLLWDGPAFWTFMPGESGGIEIRHRGKDANQTRNVGELLKTIDSRVEQYSRLLRTAILVDDQLANVFTRASKRWLRGSESGSGNERLDIMGSKLEDPLVPLVSAKLTQKLLEDFKDRISSSWNGILQLVEPILSGFVREHQQMAERRARPSAPSLRELGAITMNDLGEDGGEGEHETLSAALSLLSAVLAPSGKPIEVRDTSLVQSLQESLEYIARASASLDDSITTSASNILILLQLYSDISEHTETTRRKTPIIDTHADDRRQHRTALTHLSDEIAPIRAQGLSTLTALISKASPVLNIPSTSTLLISLLQDEDEYIYLSAIKALGLLSTNHPKTVLKTLVERYIDPHEDSTLDVRIKLGEALNRTIEHLGQLFAGDTAILIGESMIAVASRRGARTKTMQRRDIAQQKAKRVRRKEAAEEDSWDGVGDEKISGHEEDDDDNNNNNNHNNNNHNNHNNPSLKTTAHISKIVAGWSDTGPSEDIRIRTSALSILSTAISTNMLALGPTLTTTATTTILSILQLETGPSCTILRRAALHVLMSLLRALDAQGRHHLNFAFLPEKEIAEIVTVLRYVRITDTDEVVLGHVDAVMESLDAWRQKSLLWGMADPRDRDLGFRLDDDVGMAGLVTWPGRRVKIEEVLE